MSENVVVALFNVESEGFQAATELRSSMKGNDYTISQLVLVQKKDGKITPVDGFDSGVNTTDDTWYGMLIGGLIGILGGPLGMLLGMSYGGLIGATFDLDDAADNASMLEQVSAKLEDGETAVVALVQEQDESILDLKLSKYDATILRCDAAVVAQEVEEARATEKELQKQAKAQMKAQKKADREQKIQEKRNKIKADFAKDNKAE